ncbi:MAG: hypothetical protein ACYC9Y_01355 [Candidatus Methylomirabilia bacterium]
MRRTIRLKVLAAAIGTVLLGLSVGAETRAATILVKPGKLDHFVLTAPPTALAGESFIVRVEPYDASGNLINEFRVKAGVFAISVSGGGEVVPAQLRSEEFAGGAAVKVSSRHAGILELTVTEGEGRTPLTSVQTRILPNRLDRFVVNAPRAVTAGEAFQARVIAQDAYGNTKDDLADIRESLRLEIQGTGLAVAVDKAAPTFRGGEATFTFLPRKAGSIRVVAQEMRTRSAGESAAVKVNPASLDHFTVLGPKAAVAGEKFIVLISAYDAYENPVTNYEAQSDGVVLRSSGTGALAPVAVPAKEFHEGQARVALTYTKAEVLRVGAREQNREAGGESDAIVVAPGDPDQFHVSTPAEAVAGEGFPVQLEALDRFGNLIEDYDLRGLEVQLSTDGHGLLSPGSVSAASFVRGKATVSLQYNRAESFSVVAALSKEALEKLIAERKRQAVAPPAPVVSPEEAARERERESAAKAREEAQRAREEAERARDEAEKKRAKAAAAAAAKARSEAVKPPPAAARREDPAPPGKPVVKVLEKVDVEESKDQVLVRLSTSGPVSYNASTGSRLSKEWILLELFPVRVDAAVGKRVSVASSLVGEVTVEQIDPEKVRISLQVLPPGISYVVTQQDRSVVVKVVRTE